MLFICTPQAFALTTAINEDHVKYTASSISTNTTGSVTDTFPLGPFEDLSVQCIWAGVTGTQPQYKLQVSNDASNWDDIVGALVVTTNASGSDTLIVDSIPVRNARIKVSTASTDGTLDCTAVGQGR